MPYALFSKLDVQPMAGLEIMKCGDGRKASKR